VDAKQLFECLDPFPKAETYIVSWARELPAEGRLQIIVHLAAGPRQPSTETEIAASLRHFFQYRVTGLGAT
jgi:hypothetical protein